MLPIIRDYITPGDVVVVHRADVVFVRLKVESVLSD